MQSSSVRRRRTALYPVGEAERVAQSATFIQKRDPHAFAQYIVGELGNTMSTAYTYEHHIRSFERWFGKDASLADVPDVRHFLRETTYHPTTKNLVLVALRALFRFLLVEGKVDPGRAVAIMQLRGPRQRRRPKRPLSLEEVHELLDACCTPHDFRAIYLGLYQGFRVSDSAQLAPIHVRRNRISFESIKGAKWLEVPLHREVAGVLDRIFDVDKQPTRDTLKHTCRSISHYTGISFTSHRLRHTFASRQDQLGSQEGVVIELMGQEQVSVYRRHYAPVTWEAMEEAIRKHHYRAG